MENMNQIYAILSIAAGIITSLIVIFIKPVKGVIAWQERRKDKQMKRLKREERIDELITLSERICTVEKIEEHGQLFEMISNQLSTIQQSLDKLDAHDRLHDKEIQRSLEQRRIHDQALFALLDASKADGHNGPVTKAHQSMMEYLQNTANRPLDNLTERF